MYRPYSAMRPAPRPGVSARRTGVFTAVYLVFASPCVVVAGNYPFRVDAEQQGRVHLLQARNDGEAPVSVRIEVSGDNVAGLERWPQISVVRPRSSVSLGRIESANPAAGYRFNFHYSFQIGDLGARHVTDFPYRLPFRDGEGYRVLQAPGGPITTHTDRRSAYAIDFDLPEGTPVVAARDGIVFEVVTGHTFGRLDPALKGMDNHVGIYHADGSIGEYVHFRSSPYVVRPGQFVAAGTVIGYSGNTGYSSAPHLHFAVVRPVVRENGKFEAESIPVKFRFREGATPEPVRIGSVAYAGESTNTAAPMAQPAEQSQSDRSSSASEAGMANVRPPGTEVRQRIDESPSDQLAQSAPDRQSRGGVSFHVPAELSKVPIWIWVMIAVGVWVAAGLLARLVRSTGPSDRVEPTTKSGSRIS